MPQRDPIVTAKSVASLDQLSGSFRLWHWRGLECRGDGKSRHALREPLQDMRERVLAMQALWTQDKAEFHGEFVAFDPVWLYPKPKQKPYPPILLGGESDHTLRRVVEFGNGWLPRRQREFDPDRAVARLRQAAAAAGRDPTTFSITVFNAPADENSAWHRLMGWSAANYRPTQNANEQNTGPLLHSYRRVAYH